MTDMSLYDEDLGNAIQQAQDDLAVINKQKGAERMQSIRNCEKKLGRIRNIKTGYNLELRQLQDKEEQKRYQMRLREHEQAIAQILNDIKWLKTEGEKGELLKGGKGAGMTKEQAEVASQGMGNSEMLASTLQVQDNTKQSLNNTKMMIEQSKSVAGAISEELNTQNNQILSITDTMNEIEDNLTRADKLIRTFARRMLTDKIILLFTLLVFLGIVGIIVYSVMVPDQQTFTVPEEAKPPSPCLAIKDPEALKILRCPTTVPARRMLRMGA